MATTLSAIEEGSKANRDNIIANLRCLIDLLEGGEYMYGKGSMNVGVHRPVETICYSPIDTPRFVKSVAGNTVSVKFDADIEFDVYVPTGRNK